MGKIKKNYHCSECGAESSKWAGQCGDCGSWNSLTEIASAIPMRKGGRQVSGYTGSLNQKVQYLKDIIPNEQSRITTGISEFDRVLGGGLVAGSVVLLGGNPGIGKSTLLVQSLAYLQLSLRTLYVTGEESLEQVSLRAHRLELDLGEQLLLSETHLETILTIAQKEKPGVIVIDSIQTMFSADIQSPPGSVSQIRECTAQLVRYAKQTKTTLFLVGHVTKEGTLAGPRVLEHMVDTVLYFEGESDSRYRIVRAFKNRFGAVNELGVFAMAAKGLIPVNNPSSIFLSRHSEPVSGSVVMVTVEGSRPMLVEVQALVDESHLANPRRVTVGIDNNRIAMLLAVLNRHAGIASYDQDVFINVVGGVRLTETGADLAVILAIISSLRDKIIPQDTVIFGEVGLSGEIRPVTNGQERLREAVKHGYKKAIIPKANEPKKKIDGIEVIAVNRLDQAIIFD
ncbi:MAG: DNA repair protein RadA [Thiohalomonadales bacterium]